MSSYRDRRNPEAVRFPGHLSAKILIIVALFTNLVCAVAEWISTRSPADKAPEVALLIVFTVLLLRWWPRQIIVDQHGVHRLTLFGRQGVHIAWSELAVVAEATEFGGRWAAKLQLRSDTLEMAAADSRRKIVHTPRHPDRQRLLFELRQRGVGLSDDLAALADRHA